MHAVDVLQLLSVVISAVKRISAYGKRATTLSIVEICECRNSAVIVEASGHAIDVAAFREALITWGRENFRPFPWRLTHDPYHILIAEVMLHRTQAPQVMPVYEQFINRFPNVKALARVTREELHETMGRLGLRWRVDLVHEMIARLLHDFGGSIPTDKDQLLSLPGVGGYIAGAVLCFGWNRPEPLLDTNTVRVIARVFGLEITDLLRRNARFQRLVAELVDPEDPRSYNYALLDLADQICHKKHPGHYNCPVLQFCVCGKRKCKMTQSLPK